MKKTIIAAIAAFFGIFSAANAQEPLPRDLQENAHDTIIPIKPFFVKVYGGPTFSINENGGSFFQEGKAKDLLDLYGGISAGYYFSNRYGARLSFEFSGNQSSLNYDDTFAPGLFEYTFRSGAIFADWIINGGDIDKPKKFNWRPYFGIGAAYAFDFEDIYNEKAQMAHHPWQYYTTNNFCFAFRYGLILEYSFNEFFGIYVDGTHEWFTDNYNGVSPKDLSGKHAGFPFDMKLNADFGVAIHF